MIRLHIVRSFVIIEISIIEIIETIEEFIANADREFYTAIVNHLEVERNKFVLEPIKMDATEEELKQGANAHYEVPVSFDQSNFFA